MCARARTHTHTLELRLRYYPGSKNLLACTGRVNAIFGRLVTLGWGEVGCRCAEDGNIKAEEETEAYSRLLRMAGG